MTCVQPPQDTWAQGFNCALVLGDLIFACTHTGSHQSRALHTPQHPLFQSRCQQVHVALEPGARVWCWPHPNLFIGMATNQARSQHGPIGFSARSRSQFDSHGATKGNAIQGQAAHPIHTDAGAEAVVFMDNPFSQR